VEGAGQGAVASQQGVAIGGPGVSAEAAEVLHEGQLGEADLVFDADAAGLQADLDGAIDAGVGDVVRAEGPGGEQRQEQQRERRREGRRVGIQACQ
jgi:hypothetical protein